MIDEQTQFLEKLCEVALEKCAGDKEVAMSYIEGFFKTANFADFKARPDPSVGESVMKGFTEGLGKNVGSLVIGGGLATFGAALGLAQRGALHTKFLTALEKAMTLNQVLKDAVANGKRDKIKSYAETIFKFAPNVSTDPNLLGGILANTIHGDGVDVMTIKTLGDLESRFVENRSFNPKTYV